MDQKDPNTISGLLKLHLRENGLLSGESIAGLMPHIESRDMVSSLQWGGGGPSNLNTIDPDLNVVFRTDKCPDFRVNVQYYPETVLPCPL